MAFRDDDRGLLVVRIVYAGAGFAGKTTTLRSLGERLARPVYSPEEISGRTIFFDWLEYEAGLFEGRRIRCQIVSVPGQVSLAARRRSLIETADAVVFVADTSRRRLADSREQLEELLGWLAALPGPMVGLVLQANHRDAEDAISPSELKTLIPSVGRQVGIIESVAIDGSGVREAFILGVRLALDRVRELISTGALLQGRPPIDSGEELLQSIYELEDREAPSPSLAVTAPSPAAPVGGSAPLGGPVVSEGPPQPPGTNVRIGMIWPPVEGRLVLLEAAVDRCELYDRGDGCWGAGLAAGWEIETRAPQMTLEDGREALLAWARQHSASRSVLSGRRCIALAESTPGRWRLWQVVKRLPSLKDFARIALEEESEDAVVTGLLHAVRLLLIAADRFAGVPMALSPRLHEVTVEEGLPKYTGLVPPPGQPETVRGAPEAILREDLEDFFAALASARRLALLQVLAKSPLQPGDASGRQAALSLAAALQGSSSP